MVNYQISIVGQNDWTGSMYHQSRRHFPGSWARNVLHAGETPFLRIGSHESLNLEAFARAANESNHDICDRWALNSARAIQISTLQITILSSHHCTCTSHITMWISGVIKMCATASVVAGAAHFSGDHEARLDVYSEPYNIYIAKQVP